MAEDEPNGRTTDEGPVTEPVDVAANAEPATGGAPGTAGEPLPVFGGSFAEQSGSGGAFDASSLDAAALDPDEEWPARATAKGVRFRVPTIVLVALLLAAGAFWGGAAVQRSDGSTSGSSALASLASRFAGRGGGTTGTGGTTTGGAGGFGGASAAAAAGTITVIEGNTVYITSSSGAIVKVELSAGTKVSRNATATIPSLKPGDTVVVQGSRAKNGTVSATSFAATAAGVTTTGGFGGFGGGGGGAGGRAATGG